MSEGGWRIIFCILVIALGVFVALSGLKVVIDCVLKIKNNKDETDRLET